MPSTAATAENAQQLPRYDNVLDRFIQSCSRIISWRVSNDGYCEVIINSFLSTTVSLILHGSHSSSSSPINTGGQLCVTLKSFILSVLRVLVPLGSISQAQVGLPELSVGHLCKLVIFELERQVEGVDVVDELNIFTIYTKPVSPFSFGSVLPAVPVEPVLVPLLNAEERILLWIVPLGFIIEIAWEVSDRMILNTIMKRVTVESLVAMIWPVFTHNMIDYGDELLLTRISTMGVEAHL